MRSSLIVAPWIVFAACAKDPPIPVHPAPPLPADPIAKLDTMQAECEAFLAALSRWKSCPNLSEDEADNVQAWIERATLDLDAGKKTEIEANAQAQAAAACHKAADSVRAANERCNNGKRPKSDW